ncbi:MAG: multidrug efflux pump acriflavin resistance protein AcrB/AcrD/AcrF [Gammaproteobacteria bacterium]|jgi:membrane fusion protein (multidrug efflux system)|nr:multidrug efflux pump acriflavin resistance protein AcrB/AcrD/AcrF [Gammaproteobacteria bacterium]
MKRRALLSFGLPAVLAAALVVYGVVGRERSLASLTRVANEQANVPVQVISPQRGPSTRPLVLPGTVRAWYEAPIFAQVAGYVQSWNEDYGASVKAGQLLATIDAPSLDAQYAAAKANLNVAQANYRLAVSTAARWQALAGTPAVSKQEVDVQAAGAAARKAEMEASAQDVARYAALEAFKRVVAPFDGVVTARLTDVGSYVNAAGGDVSVRGNSAELFTVSDVHEMRVFVSVPQDYANLLGPHTTATLHQPSQPGKSIEAKFLTTARAFNPSTRTAETELTVDNSNHALWPGTYVDVEFHVPSDQTVLTMPEAALIFRADGAQVAIVDAQNRVHLRNVTLGQNLGQTVQVTSGLSLGDKLVNNPPAGLLEGQSVQSVTPATGYAMAPQKAPQPTHSAGSANGDGQATKP